MIRGPEPGLKVQLGRDGQGSREAGAALQGLLVGLGHKRPTATLALIERHDLRPGGSPFARSAGAHTSPTDNTLPGTEPADADATAGSQDAAPFVDPSEFVRSLLRDGLLPAMRVDPVVLRAFLRMFNLLTPPDSLMNDADVISRVMAVYQDRDNRPPEPALGPDRDGFLSELADRRRSPTADAAPS